MALLTEADIKALSEKPVLEENELLDFHNPPHAFQQMFTGGSFQTSYNEAAMFLNHMFDRIEEHSGKIDFKGKRIVDFGCGWGRMLRLLRSRPELAEAELFGCDQHPEALRICQKTIPNAWFSKTTAYPPCALRSGFVDIVYAYSVFTHLNEAPHLLWASELGRILRPGGYACVTVQPRDFISFCKDFREGTRPPKNPWHEALAKAFVDDVDCFRRYDAGEIVFDDAVGGAGVGGDVYGDALAPKAFIEKHWGRMGFKLVDWFEQTEPFRLQTRALLQKVR